MLLQLCQLTEQLQTLLGWEGAVGSLEVGEVREGCEQSDRVLLL